jgi:hypothetical protein
VRSLRVACALCYCALSTIVARGAFIGVCCVLRVACGALCGALRDACCLLRIAYCVLRIAYCVLRIVCCMLLRVALCMRIL